MNRAPDRETVDLERRRFLAWSAAASAAFLAGCELAPNPRPTEGPSGSISATSPGASARGGGTPPATGPAEPASSAPTSPEPSQTAGSPSPGAPRRRTLYRDGALADGRSERLQIGVSILVEDGRIRWIRPSDDEGPLGSRSSLEVIDASGSTIVPGLVDCHSHVTLPGGAHWIDRGSDPPERLLAYAEANGRLLTAAGVRWARDVGAPRGRDPIDGRVRALSLGVRDRWRERPEMPRIRAAGTWLVRTGTRPSGITIAVDDADGLLRAALAQLDDGADLVKLYLDGPDPTRSPWTAAEVRRVVEAVHARGAKVTAHATNLEGAGVAAAARVDAVEHGFVLDADVARAMAANGVALVSTLTVLRSWLTFARTTRLERFASASGRRAIAERLERAEASVRAARAAGVAVCTGTDFGGGSARANQLAWEVESLVAAGFEPWEALGAATWRGGELLGEPSAGVIVEGGPADFVLVHGDPTSDPEALWRVWHVAWAR
ncbi:MAG TPA: amidohydrolase family protein [Candidatus Binatia bacterium]|nr:amidohydrolase family protein [Candidatus Binatia bacterium]